MDLRNAVPPLQPFTSNLSTVRQREGDTPSTARPSALGMHGNFTLGSCCVVAPIATISTMCRRALDFTCDSPPNAPVATPEPGVASSSLPQAPMATPDSIGTATPRQLIRSLQDAATQRVTPRTAVANFLSANKPASVSGHDDVPRAWELGFEGWEPPPTPPPTRHRPRHHQDAAPSISMSDLTPASRSTAESDMVPTDVTPQLSSEYANSEEPSVIPVVTAANPLSIREDPRSVLAPLVRSPRAVERKAPTLDVQDDNSRATTFGISQTSPIYQDSPINTDEKPTLPVPAPRVVTCDHVDAILPEGLPVSISSADQAHSNFAPTVFSPGSSKPLASNALNGRKHKYSLRSRVNTG